MTTANMNLTLPTPTITTGPLWANELNSNLSLIDAHDHTTGKGMLVPVAGLDINDDLPFGGVYGVQQASFLGLYPQLSAPPGGTKLYANSVGDLFYRNGSSFPVQITTGNNVVPGTSGGITGLVSPAGASYDVGTETFKFYRDVGASAFATVEHGPLVLHTTTASAPGLQIQPSASMVTGYTLTLPPTLPVSVTSFQSVDTGGTMANVAPDNSTIEISSNTLRVKPLGVDTAQIADSAIETVKVNDAAVTLPKLANFSLVRSSGSGTWTNGASAITGPTAIPNLSVTITSGSSYRPIFIGLLPDDGLGAGGFAKITANHSMRVFLEVTSGSPPAVDYKVTTLLASTGLSPPASIQGIYPLPSAGVVYTVAAYVDVGTGSNPTPDVAGLILFAYQP